MEENECGLAATTEPDVGGFDHSSCFDVRSGASPVKVWDQCDEQLQTPACTNLLLVGAGGRSSGGLQGSVKRHTRVRSS